MEKIDSEIDLEIDGSIGEGGGQVLRTALTLSCITGKSLRIFNIRAGRSKPGLQLQHEMSALAACEICNGTINGCKKGSMEITLFPGKIKSGEYNFDIKSAGSSILLLQTIVPILWFGQGASIVRIKGGTHNGMSPSYDFYKEVFCPLMPVKTECELIKYGFYPAGGGEIVVKIDPFQITNLPIQLLEKGSIISKEYVLTFTKTGNIANKFNELGGDYIFKYNEVKALGKGMPILSAKFNYQSITEIITVYHEKNCQIQKTKNEFDKFVSEYENSMAPVDEHLADQLLLPLVLVSGGKYKAVSISKNSKHFETNVSVIELFLGKKIFITEVQDGFEIVINY